MQLKHRTRLLKLANYLYSMDSRKFLLATLIEFNENDDKPTEKNYTKACAAGLCFVVFNRTFKWRPEFRYDDQPAYLLLKLKEFFGLDARQIQELFVVSSYKYGRRGPISVANKIEKLIMKKT